jgi:ABC-type transport system involved in multi-copper enzyme maturation permease subunit
LFIGPVFTREAVTAPRRGRFFFYRSLYVTGLLLLMCTAWLVYAGTQIIRNVGDIARFGSVLFFEILVPLQLALVVFLSAMLAAGAVAQEKDRKTLILLLMTRMSNSELVLGKLLASLLNVLVMLTAALPLFAFFVVLGGVSFVQVGRVFAVTVVTALAAGSLGSTIALWREKTFQTLSMTVLALVFWLGIWEVVELLGQTTFLGVSCTTWASGFSPLRAVLAAASPFLPTEAALGPLESGVNLFLVIGVGVTLLLNAVAVARVRIWNPTREVRLRQEQEQAPVSIWGVEHDLAQEKEAIAAKAEAARQEHVDARTRGGREKTRQVWDNPVLWREMCTWAYGRKVLVIRLAYLVLFVFAALGLHWSLSVETVRGGNELATIVPAPAWPLAPFFLVSMAIVNALAVTSITNERDGRSLDILLVTDLSPREFLFGKLWGVMWVTREMIALPLLLCLYLWLRGGVSLESLLYVIGGLAVLNVFVATLGIHCGMTYANSRTAISVSMGTFFFLCLGVVTCILMMISFSGSFQTQFYPFAALILGGGVGLFVALGARNPSAAIGAASLLLPFATFYAIVSFMLEYTLPVFLVIGLVYGFTTAAMLIPALGEFNIAMGRARTAAEDE